MIIKILKNGLKTGAVLALTSTTAMMAAGEAENGAPWSAINSVAHIIDGDNVTQPNEFSLRESAIGLTVNATAMACWGVTYEGALAVTKQKSTPITGLIGAIGAYFVDYVVVPKRFTPGIEKKISKSALYAIYTVLAVTFALSTLWNRDS